MGWVTCIDVLEIFAEAQRLPWMNRARWDQAYSFMRVFNPESVAMKSRDKARAYTVSIGTEKKTLRLEQKKLSAKRMRDLARAERVKNGWVDGRL